jgi:hypothetical protein
VGVEMLSGNLQLELVTLVLCHVHQACIQNPSSTISLMGAF